MKYNRVKVREAFNLLKKKQRREEGVELLSGVMLRKLETDANTDYFLLKKYKCRLSKGKARK